MTVRLVDATEKLEAVDVMTTKMLAIDVVAQVVSGGLAVVIRMTVDWCLGTDGVPVVLRRCYDLVLYEMHERSDFDYSDVDWLPLHDLSACWKCECWNVAWSGNEPSAQMNLMGQHSLGVSDYDGSECELLLGESDYGLGESECAPWIAGSEIGRAHV